MIDLGSAICIHKTKWLSELIRPLLSAPRGYAATERRAYVGKCK